MIGDNLNADILGGNKCGLTTLYKYGSKDESKFVDIFPDAVLMNIKNFNTNKKIQV